MTKMFIRWCATSLVCLSATALLAQDRPLTLKEVLQLARQRSVTILAARDRIEEARGRLKGASVLLQSNPVLEGIEGLRRTPTGDLNDRSLGISQTFELGGQRGARITGAQADIARETATSENTSRELLSDVARAFWRAVAAGRRVRFAQSQDQLAGELMRGMQRRYELGDVAILDVNLARIAASRARASLRTAEIGLTEALSDVRLLAGMSPDDTFALEGDLEHHPAYKLEELAAQAMDRPDLRAIGAGIKQAEAEGRLGRALRRPDLALGFTQAHEEGDNVTRGSLSLTLPVFSHGQELQAVSQARITRLRRELEGTKRAIAIQIRSAYEVYQHQVQAAGELYRGSVQTIDENETLARRSYEEGEISLIELLQIRREVVDTHLIYLDRQLEAALADVELQSRAGVLK